MKQAAEQLDVALLEPLLRRCVDLIGLPKTLAMVEYWGGLQLYVAKEPSEDGDLARVIGLADARILGREFGGERLVLPKAGRALRALRDQRLRADSGVKSLRQLCIEHRLTERRICQILAGVEADDEPGLFD